MTANRATPPACLLRRSRGPVRRTQYGEARACPAQRSQGYLNDQAQGREFCRAKPSLLFNMSVLLALPEILAGVAGQLVCFDSHNIA